MSSYKNVKYNTNLTNLYINTLLGILMATEKILIVEDELIEAMNFEEFLKSSGYDVVGIASTGAEAINKTDELKPNLILMDIVLKGEMDGIEAAAQIKENYNIPIVYLTAHPEENTVNRAKLTSPYGYIIKPASKTDLKNIIELALYKHQMERKLEESEEKYRKLFDNALDMITLTEEMEDLLPGKFIEVNKTGIERLGYTRDEFLNMTPMDIVAPEKHPEIPPIVEKIKNSGYDKFESIHLSKDGKKIPVEVYNHQIELNGKKVVLAVSRDITKRKEAGNAIIKTERKYSELVDNSLVAVYETNFNGEILFANDAMVQMFEYESITDLKAKNMVQLYKNAADRGKLYKNLKKYKTVTQYEVEAKSKTGRSFNVMLNAHLLDNTIIGMIMDITERKNAEIRLKRSEQRFRAVAETAIDAIVTTDINGTILFCNESLGTIFGYSRGEIIGAELTILMPDRYKKEYINELERFKSLGRHTLLGKTLKTTGLKKDGTEFPFEMSLSAWKSGEKTFFTAIIRDITKNKQIEKALRDSEEKYRTLFEADPDYTILVSLDGVLLDINPAAERMIGRSKEELVGKHFLELDIFPKDELKLLKENFSKLKKHGDRNSYEMRIIDKNGLIRWVQNASTIIKKGNMGYVLEIGSDITERKYAEEEIKSSLKDKEVLLKEIHHRVKNNLQIISSLLDLQSTYVKEDSTAVNVLRESQNRVLSMALIHEMLYQSKDLSRVDFSNYIRNLVFSLFTSYCVKTNIKPIISVEKTFLNIETSIPLSLIISELVSNSLKYAFPQRKSGEISISLQSQNNHYKLIISDNGIGLPPEINFKNVKSSLGLRLVNSLINQLDGTIELDRSHHGTKFIITFKELKYEKRV